MKEYYEFVNEEHTHHMCWTIEELEELINRKYKNYDYINCDYDFLKIVKKTKNYKIYHYSSIEDLKNNKYEYIERI